MKTVRHAIVFLLTVVLSVPQGASADDAKKKTAPPKRTPNPAMAKIEDVAGLPRVLLIGDSISIGYTVPVRELLKGKANVHRPLTNCGPTTKASPRLSSGWAMENGTSFTSTGGSTT